MKIAKKIQKLLDRREKLAVDLMNISNQLDEWLEKHGGRFYGSRFGRQHNNRMQNLL